MEIVVKIIEEQSYEKVSQKASQLIAKQIISNPKSVLGLSTGNTPVLTYEKLVELYDRGLLDFSGVTTFNLDEYLRLPESHEKSFHRYMKTKLFSKVNLRKKNTFLPDGLAEEPKKEAQKYERKVKGEGVDLMVLGLGVNGHIGFNEPGTRWGSKTRVVKLTEETRERNFPHPEQAPDRAITMGIKTIMHSKKILLLASGAEKAFALEKSIEGSISRQWPASILQIHPDTILIADKQATAGS